MTGTEIETRIKEILTKRIGIPPQSIDANAGLVDELGVDSVDMVELTIAAEEAFDVSLTEEALEDVKTVSDVVHVVQRLRAEKSAATAGPAAGR